jgi:hypothetical protein
VITLHTVLMDPEEKVREVVEGTVETSLGVIVMTRRSRRMLLEQYGAPAWVCLRPMRG